MAVTDRELRRHWRRLIAIGLIAGSAGAAMLGVAGLARRTSTAFGRLGAADHTEDARITLAGNGDLARRITALPEVSASWVASGAVGRVEGGPVTYISVLSGPRPPNGLFTPVVISGRAFVPSSAGEVVVSDAFGRAFGLKTGSVLALKMLLAGQFNQFGSGNVRPGGPLVTLHVTGVVRLPNDTGMENAVIAGPAFFSRYGDALAEVRPVYLRLRGRTAGVRTLMADLDRLARARGPQVVVQTAYPSDQSRSVAATARILAGGLGIVAAVAGLAALLLIGQALSRHHTSAAGEQRVEAALGMTAAERVMARALAAFLAAAAAALTAAMGALGAAGLTPPGAIGRQEPHPGWAPNLALIGVGATALAAAVVAIAALTAWRAARRPGRLRSVRRAGRLPRGPAWAAVGSRLAWPSMLTGGIVVVASVFAAGTFGVSLHRLAASPPRWGWNGQFDASDVTPPLVQQLAADPRVQAVTVFTSASVHVGGLDAPGYSTRPGKGSLGWTMLRGRPPGGPGEAAVGPRLARRLGVRVGSLVAIDRPSGPSDRVRVVGVGIGPILNSEQLGNAVLLAPDQLVRVERSQPFVDGIVRVAPGESAAAIAAELAGRHEVHLRQPPAEVANLAQLGRLPDWVAGLLALAGAAGLAQALVIATRRRGCELAVMRALGFTPGQATGSVVGMAGTTVLAGLVAGVPIGLEVGRLTWWAVSRSASIATDVNVPVLAVAAAAAGVLVVALGIALVAGRGAGRLHLATILRAE